MLLSIYSAHKSCSQWSIVVQVLVNIWRGLIEPCYCSRPLRGSGDWLVAFRAPQSPRCEMIKPMHICCQPIDTVPVATVQASFNDKAQGSDIDQKNLPQIGMKDCKPLSFDSTQMVNTSSWLKALLYDLKWRWWRGVFLLKCLLPVAVSGAALRFCWTFRCKQCIKWACLTSVCAGWFRWCRQTGMKRTRLQYILCFMCPQSEKDVFKK